MIEKHSNGLILFIIILIIALGGVYYVKTVGNNGYSAKDNTYSENKETIGNVSDISSNYNISQKGYKYNNRYYYNQLSECAKAMYDTVVDNLDDLQRGSCTIQIDYDFNSLLKSSNGGELLDNYYNDAINAINLDIPNLFYLDFQKLYINIEKKSSLFSTRYKVFINSKYYKNFYIDEFTSTSQVLETINQIDTIKSQIVSKASGNDYNKIRYVHDWIIDYMAYDMEYDEDSAYSTSVYGGLIEKKGVCEAYARTYKYILDELGIENILIKGTATNSIGNTENHMWNYVKLYGNWYAVDITWDDPIIKGTGSVSGDYKHKYFLIRKPRIL